jgi:hypothetical protein
MNLTPRRHLPIPYRQRRQGRTVPEHPQEHEQQQPRHRSQLQGPPLQRRRRFRRQHIHRLSRRWILRILHRRPSRLPPGPSQLLHDQS